MTWRTSEVKKQWFSDVISVLFFLKFKVFVLTQKDKIKYLVEILIQNVMNKSYTKDLNLIELKRFI